jgi:hypothetical protein
MAYKDIKTSPKYKVKGGAAKAAYANGGRIAQGKGKTTVNIIVPQGAPPQVSAAPGGPMPPAPPPPGPMGPGGPPMPPGGAGAAGIKAMQGFKKGGRVPAGAAGGLGRLEKIPAAKRALGKRNGGKAC